MGGRLTAPLLPRPLEPEPTLARSPDTNTGRDRRRLRAQIVPIRTKTGLLQGSIQRKYAGGMRAACRNRTDDLLITSEMLYRLS